MHTILFSLVGLLALSIIGWQAWKDRVVNSATIPPDWRDRLQDISTAQAQGRYRDARTAVRKLCGRLERMPRGTRIVPVIQTRLLAMMAKDPVYPEVVRATRIACAHEPAVSELQLCVGLRQYLIEDIRSCVELAEHFGQVRRKELAGSAMVIAQFHLSAD